MKGCCNIDLFIQDKLYTKTFLDLLIYTWIACFHMMKMIDVCRSYRTWLISMRTCVDCACMVLSFNFNIYIMHIDWHAYVNVTWVITHVSELLEERSCTCKLAWSLLHVDVIIWFPGYIFFPSSKKKNIKFVS